MLRKKILILVLPLTMLGLFGVAILSPAASSQTDYEEYLITETNTEQKLNQKNIGSGGSTNINCGINTAGTNLHQPITCPTVPGENVPGETPTLIPVVTQRVVEVQITGQPIDAQSPCNPDEVVTGGGFDISNIYRGLSGDEAVIEEFAVNNAWHIRVTALIEPQFIDSDTFRVYSECLKLVPR